MVIAGEANTVNTCTGDCTSDDEEGFKKHAVETIIIIVMRLM